MKIFEDAVGTIAHDFGIALDEIRSHVDFAHATADLDIPGRNVKKGTVAGLLVTWQGVIDDIVVVELVSQWVLSPEIDPAWDVAMAYILEIEGTPNLNIRIDIVPDLDEASDDETDTVAGLLKTGMIMSALPPINAIPGVVKAQPGILSVSDLPPVASVIRPDAARSQRAPFTPSVAREAAPPARAAAPRPTPPGLRGVALRALERIASKLRDPDEVIPDGAPGTLEGRWQLVIATPGKAVPSTLEVEKKADGYVGTQTAEGVTEPIRNVTVDGHRVRWGAKLTKPMPLNVAFEAVLTEGRMAGKVKTRLFGSFPFTAHKDAP